MAKNQRITKIVNEIKFRHNLNQGQIAAKLGVTPTYLSDMINGRSPMNDTFLSKVHDVFGIVSSEDSSDSVLRIQKTFGGSPEQQKVVSLPLIPIDAVAGTPGEDVPGVTLDDCEQYTIPEFSAKGAELLIRVSGSSMLPTYSNGDILAIRRITSATFFQWGMVYVLDTNQGALVKRIFEDKEDPDMIICHSDNFEHYPEFKIPKEEIRSFALVVGMIRME